MTSINFDGRNLSLGRVGVSFSTELVEWEAKWLRNRLLKTYPLETDTTPVAGPLHEVTLAEARPGDIATFEIKSSPVKGKFVCTIKKHDDDTLRADKWLTANKMRTWCIRNHMGDDGGNMKDLHIWRWDGVEEAIEVPDPPTVAGWYITATSDQVLYNDGTYYANWSRPHGARWSTDQTYEDWEVVVHDLGPERLPLKFISESED